MCFAPQRRATFHLSSDHIAPAPAALASLLVDPPEPQIIGKTQCFATFLPFRAPGSFFFGDFLFLIFFLLLFSSLTLPISAFHLSILSEVWLPNFLRSSIYFVRIQSCQIPNMFHQFLDTRLWKPLKNRKPTVEICRVSLERKLCACCGACDVNWLAKRRPCMWPTDPTQITSAPVAKEWGLQSAKIAKPSQTTTAKMETQQMCFACRFQLRTWKWWPQRILEAALNALRRIPWSGTQDVNHSNKQLFWLCAFWRGVCCQTVVARLVRHGQPRTYHNLTSRKARCSGLKVAWWCLVGWHVNHTA